LNGSPRGTSQQLTVFLHVFDEMPEPLPKNFECTKALISNDVESPNQRCKIKSGNVYGNEGKAWVVGSFHLSFKE